MGYKTYHEILIQRDFKERVIVVTAKGTYDIVLVKKFDWDNEAAVALHVAELLRDLSM